VSDPFTAYDFRVEIVLPGTAEPLCQAAFAECEGLELRFEVTSLQEGGDRAGRRLLTGPASFGEVTLRRGMTESFDLWKWCGDPSVRADARVVMLGVDGGPRAVFRLRNCLPVRLRAPRLDAVGGVVAVEELQLACEGLVLEGAGGRDRPALRKAELRALDAALRREVDKERWVQVQLNPRDLRLSYADPEAARLALELWFEADDVRKLTQRVAYFAPPGPPVRFVWGSLRFDGRVEALDETLDLFAPDGTALRARLALTLKGAVTGNPQP
jgi:phage tail-like protein